ncbi:secretion system X translation initiation factor [Nitrosovibrio sp. Nv17]|uniref:secretion system X translation initiation factor n=1 Tax=Nitrosovibrio sp. Nv17 TaxID=1855339 RepID=UPI0009085C71|nr:secretion system X translation initiation factor [Nitrosovibrio sp. Nv17]SFW37752.1 hypothetical protein SAMN05216414_12711 [Nitrosovibrio sp. Nv17]
MSQAGKTRAGWLGAALLATLLAARWVSGGDDDTESAPEASGPASSAQGDRSVPAVDDDTAQLALERLERREFAAQAGELFSSQTWLPPPVPESERPPAPPPPLMFKYLGKVVDGDETRVFLSLSDRNYIVKAGERIDSQYQVDEVTDHAITFTYLPLKAKQMLAIGGMPGGRAQ